MMDNESRGRRRFMSGLSALLSGGVLMSGGAAGDSVEKLNSKLKVNDEGRVTVDGVSVQKYSPNQDLTEVTPNTQRELLQYAAAVLNQGIEREMLAVVDGQDGVVVRSLVSAKDVLTDQSDREVTTTCGKNHVTWVLGAVRVEVNIWMDDPTTEAVALALLGAGGVSAAIGILLKAIPGIGSLPGAVAGIVGVALTTASGSLGIINDGCGVKIIRRKYPSDPSKDPTTTISAQ